MKLLIINNLKRLEMSETLIEIIRDYGMISYFAILIVGLVVFAVFKKNCEFKIWSKYI